MHSPMARKLAKEKPVPQSMSASVSSKYTLPGIRNRQVVFSESHSSTANKQQLADLP